jgi:hypothetical protein
MNKIIRQLTYLYEFIFRKSKYAKHNNVYSRYQSIIFNIITIGCYIALFLSYFIESQNMLYVIQTLRYLVSIYAGLFLVFRFNSFRTIKFNDFDRKIAFHSGVFILYGNLLSLYIYPYLSTQTTIGIKISKYFK